MEFSAVKNYKLKAITITLNNKVYRKEDGFLFNIQNTNPNQLDLAVNAGLLEEIVVKSKKQ